jgi:hypothetical protein
VRLGVSLPGPFYASFRLGGRRRRGRGLIGELIGFFGWMVVGACKATLWLMWWTLVFAVWAYAAAALLATWGYRTWAARRAGLPAPGRPALGLATALRAAEAPRRR